MDNCFVKMCEIRDKLSISERKIVDAIIADPQKVCLYSVTELAEYCHTSPATITRMCKSLGYSGYRDFIKCLILDVSNKTTSNEFGNDYVLIEQNESLEDIVNKVISNNALAIKNSYRVVDLKELRRAVCLLSKTKRIYFYGIGGSSIAALDAEHRFLRIGKDAHAFTSYHEQIFAAANLTKDDAAVIISYSGETNEILDVARLCKQVGATIISITRYSNNTLSDIADVKLKTTSIGNSIRSVASGAQIAQLNMIDILYSAVAMDNYDELIKFYSLTDEIINKSKKNI